MPTSLRTAKAADALAIATVHIRSWQVAYRGIFPDDFLASLRVEERAKRYTLDAADGSGPRTVLAVETQAAADGREHERVLGFATTGRCRDADARDAGELWALYVDPTHWGRGVGRTLMADAYEQFSRMGVCDAVLWVLVGNARAARFYSADGWLPDGSRRDEDVWDVPATVLRYRRTLG